MSDQHLAFDVDVAGIIDLMGTSLYSRPEVAVRELIQNAHDAVMRRRQIDIEYHGRIDVRRHPKEERLEFSDDGIGLTMDEARRYLGTLGAGATGALKRAEGESVEGELIGQFGVGLFSAFLIADRIVVETRKQDEPPVRWEADLKSGIRVGPGSRDEPGTTVLVDLKPNFTYFASDEKSLESAIVHYADFLPIPIHIDDRPQRANVAAAAWLDPTPDLQAVELELENIFQERALHVFSVQTTSPTTVKGALYVTPQRTLHAGSDPGVVVTVNRMVISRSLYGLMPPWAAFVRGIVELSDCQPTTSRESLIYNVHVRQVQSVLEESILAELFDLEQRDRDKLRMLVDWHRYAFAGAALDHPKLRELLTRNYLFATSQGDLPFDEILSRCRGNALAESECDCIVWSNTNRRQEGLLNSLFQALPFPCVHAVRAFEHLLLEQMASDAAARHTAVMLRPASPASPSFAETVLGLRELEPVADRWQAFLGNDETNVYIGEGRTRTPVYVFPSDGPQLERTFRQLRTQGKIPSAFQKLIDRHVEAKPAEQRKHQVVLNRSNELVRKALDQRPGMPLPAVLRLMVYHSLTAAGVPLDEKAHDLMQDDLAWIAEALQGRRDGESPQ
ncbi:ATP-binding protein [Thermostilla marina]